MVDDCSSSFFRNDLDVLDCQSVFIVIFEQQQKICFSLQHKQTGNKIFRTFKRHTEIIGFELNRLPAWSTFNVARTYCIGGKMSVKQQEQRLLQCLLKVRNRTKNMPPASRPSLNKIEACASTLCQRELPHLSASCKRL